MKNAFLFFLLLMNVVCATEKKAESTKYALSGFQKFEVITFFSPYDKIDQNVVYNSVTESFKKIGQVTVSENESMLSTLLQFGANYPICYFSIEKEENQIEVSLHVLSEVEVLPNRYKTTCPIWKKTLFLPIPQNNSPVDLVISNLIQEIVKSLAEDYMKANDQDTKHLFFHIRKFKDL